MKKWFRLIVTKIDTVSGYEWVRLQKGYHVKSVDGGWVVEEVIFTHAEFGEVSSIRRGKSRFFSELSDCEAYVDKLSFLGEV